MRTGTDNEVPVEIRTRRRVTDSCADLMVVMQEISGQVEREQRQHAAELALENAFDGIYVTDDAGTIQHVGGQFEAVTGYAAEDALGTHASILAPGTHDRARFVDRYDTASSSEGWTEEVINERATGEQFAAKRTVVPILETGAGLDGFVVVQNDVTDAKLCRQQLDVFHRVLRHDLRNAITVLQGHTEQLLEQVESDEHGHRLEIIERRLHSLLETSEKARDARETVLTDGSPSRQRELVPAIENLTEQMESSHPDDVIQFDHDFDSPVWVDGRATTALRELVENAFEHAGDTTTRVSVTAEFTDDSVTVTVSDNGPGIADEERMVIESRDEGPLQHTSGLGLWLVNWIVETLGGTVEIAVPGQRGTAVAVTLPVSDTES
jgi:PAS domain S-box-containing protein